MSEANNNIAANIESNESSIKNDNQKYEHLLGLLPENLRKRFNCDPAFRNLANLKKVLFSLQNESHDGAVCGDYRKISGAWHKVKKDGSLYAFGLSRPCAAIEAKWLTTLPHYSDYVEGEAYFI